MAPCPVQKKKKKAAAGAVDQEAGEAEGDAGVEPPAEGAEDVETSAKSASQIKREKQKAAAARKKAAAEATDGTAEAEHKEGAMRAAAAAMSWSTDIRGIKAWMSFPASEEGGTAQTWPPTVPVSKMFPSGNVPMGEQVDYVGDQQYRTTKAELRELERLQNIHYQELRTAAECHRQVRTMKPKGFALPSALPRQGCATDTAPPRHTFGKSGRLRCPLQSPRSPRRSRNQPSSVL
jgi:hypothetical protein